MTTPTDQAARDAIARDLDDTMFVEAGAGSGKTKSLVDRFAALVTDAKVPAHAVAAITFTEKAAGELVDRVRGRLETVAPDALADLDRAAVCTLHSFAQRILTQHPIEAGLPPRISVLDEIASQIAFEERWNRFVDCLIEDAELERPLRFLLELKVSIKHLHEVAVKFGQNWDLVEERVGHHDVVVPELDIAAVYAAGERLEDLACGGDDNDTLKVRCDEIGDWLQSLRDAPDDETRLRLLGRELFKVGNLGNKNAWNDKAAVVDAVRAVDAARTEAVTDLKQASLERVAEALAVFTVDSAKERQAAGELEFHDLLVLARRVLRHPDHGVDVRNSLRRRYQRLLLDEFQDTDPIQVELAVLIASSDPDAASKEWWEVPVDAGRLFFVGDPKQSIYRFRRADIAMFLTARDEVGGRVEQLTTNFRTVKPILDWVNHTFAKLIVAEPGCQPEYVALDAWRTPDTDGPRVRFLGVEAHPIKGKAADLLREYEADDVARAIREAYGDGWTVFDEKTEEWRPTSWSDIAILLPARTSLRQLERSLERFGVPYRTETSSLVYGTREVRDLVMVARAVEDPTDSLAVVAALRTPAFGCGDDDLYTWRNLHGGAWDHQRPFPDDAPADHPVAIALTWLGELHRQRYWLSPSQVLDRIVRDRRLLEVAYVHPRPRDLWRRLRFVVDQCRAWEESGGGTLRDYLRWVALQSAEGARVVETVLPETDDDAVRILTIHGAKGLEFPIVVLSGMTTQLERTTKGVDVLFTPGSDRWQVRLSGELSTEEYDLFKPMDEQMDRYERRRLLYVAATRARDHLIVSVHRKVTKNDKTAAGLFHEHGWNPELGLVEAMVFLDDEPADVAFGHAFTLDPVPVPPFDEWRAELDAVRVVAERPTAVSATKLAELAEAERLAGLQKDPRDIDLPPWQKGRYGSAIGRAVHGVMQVVDFKAPYAGLEEAVKAQAAAEGVQGKEDVIEKLCRSALTSEVVQRAAKRPHWREVYVGVPHEEYGVLEGYIDLLYLDDDGYVVVDYKTDAWSAPDELDAKVDRYSVQLGAYTAVVGTVMREASGRSALLFLGEGEAVLREVPIR